MEVAYKPFSATGDFYESLYTVPQPRVNIRADLTELSHAGTGGLRLTKLSGTGSTRVETPSIQEYLTL